MRKKLIFQNGSMEIKNQTDEKAELYLYGDIVSDQWNKWTDDDTCPTDVREFLAGIEDKQYLDIHINSGGGSVFAGITIYHALKRCEAYKTVYIDGIAASIASVIAMCADKLVMAVGSILMIHKPMSVYFFEAKNADELRKDADTLDQCQKSIMDIYESKAKVDRGVIENYVNEETWMDRELAAECFDIELEDGVEAVACTSNYFNRYQHLPESMKQKPKEGSTNNSSSEKTVEEIVDIVIEKLGKQQAEKEIKNILSDLDSFGTKSN